MGPPELPERELNSRVPCFSLTKLWLSLPPAFCFPSTFRSPAHFSRRWLTRISRGLAMGCSRVTLRDVQTSRFVLPPDYQSTQPYELLFLRSANAFYQRLFDDVHR
jgi:hypothetical protein